MKQKLHFFAILLSLLTAITIASCSSESSSSSGESYSDGGGFIFTGSFIVNGIHYSEIEVFENGTYSMSGSTGSDNGTYTTFSYYDEETSTYDEAYQCTSTVHGGTFGAYIDDTGYMHLSNGSLSASGTGECTGAIGASVYYE
ncbi:MAG: hypothetical protein IKP51_05400 [Treponema sp.]|nr:hypothetical protein [Treponema sp.]